MTEPLIDLAKIADAVERGLVADDMPITRVLAAMEVMAYLREVLTPEALDPIEPDVPKPGWVTHSTGHDLHSRIFGEER